MKIIPPSKGVPGDVLWRTWHWKAEGHPPTPPFQESDLNFLSNLKLSMKLSMKGTIMFDGVCKIGLLSTCFAFLCLSQSRVVINTQGNEEGAVSSNGLGKA